MKKELLSVENGRIIKNGNVIFNGLYLQIYMDEIAGIICDDIQTQKHLNDFLRGELELESGRIYLNEKRIDNSQAGKIFSRQVTFIDKKSKLIDTITMEDNIFLFSDQSFFVNKLKYKEHFIALQKKFGVCLPANQKPSGLTTKDRIIVELMKAFIEDKKLIVLDDLSEYLQKREVEEIFSLLLNLQKFKITFLVRIGFEDEYLHQINRVTAIKGNKTMAVLDPSKQDVQTFSRRLFFDESTVKMNVKKNILNLNFKRETIMKFENVSASYLNDINFSMKQGTLLKIHCFDDLSCSQMIDLLKGEIKPVSGRILYKDCSYKVKDIYSAIHQGICFIEQSAYDSMLFHNMSIVENLSIPCNEKIKNFWLFSKYSESIAKQLEHNLGKKTLKLQTKNQKSSVLQQIIYYKWLLYFPKIIVCINPFSDVDIYMREKTIDMIRLYLERGISVIIITTNIYTVNKFDGEIIRISKGKQLDGTLS
ncbi:MAG: ABC-type sugar transport system ATPase component-like protein [Caproiciproducens sp.]|nr:ABC-type sugar transport system ATPase component-like protein [Caproiciproducens sp.]